MGKTWKESKFAKQKEYKSHSHCKLTPYKRHKCDKDETYRQ